MTRHKRLYYGPMRVIHQYDYNKKCTYVGIQAFLPGIASQPERSPVEHTHAIDALAETMPAFCTIAQGVGSSGEEPNEEGLWAIQQIIALLHDDIKKQVRRLA